MKYTHNSVFSHLPVVIIDHRKFNSIHYSHYSFYREIEENNINLKEKVIPVEIVSLQLKNMCVVAQVAKAFVSATTTLK